MTSGTRAVVAGFALANLYLLRVTGPLVSPQHEFIFHLPGSATRFFLPAIFDVLLLFALLTISLVLTRRHPRAELLVWSGLLLPLPSALLATGYGFAGKGVPLWLACPVAVTAFGMFVLLNRRRTIVLPQLCKALNRVALLLSFLALPQLLLFAQLLWYGWQARELNTPSASVQQPVNLNQTGKSSTRVLWIILDELSFDQLYGHRYPGLALPNFDRLATESVLFTQALPAAEYTRLAVPSMLTGQALRLAQPSADGHTLTLYAKGSSHRRPLDPADTVFGDAQRAGLQTAVAGWYEPYCRLLPGVLNRCFWTYSDEPLPGMRVNASIVANIVGPLMHFLQVALSPFMRSSAPNNSEVADVQRHRADYDDLLAASDALLLSAQPGLTLLHMPIPHPWGFYDRHSKSFPQYRTSYLDNLALADAYIGRVREELEQKGVWDSTALLIMGDHSWRTASVWGNSGHWTAEEQAASHGQAYDPRPAVILKLANQHSPGVVSGKFEAVRTRALIDQLCTQSIRTPEDLQRWVAGSAAPPAAAAVSAAPVPVP